MTNSNSSIHSDNSSYDESDSYNESDNESYNESYNESENSSDNESENRPLTSEEITKKLITLTPEEINKFSLTSNDIADMSIALTPKELAIQLFNKKSSDPACSHLFMCSPNDDDMDNEGVFFHEMLLTILLEGIMIIYDNLNNVSFNDITIDSIIHLNPWFNAMQWNLHVSQLHKPEDEAKYIKFYSKIILKKNPEYTLYFKIKNIQSNYTFFLNPLYGTHNYPNNKLADIYSILFVNNTVFKIHFTNNVLI